MQNEYTQTNTLGRAEAEVALSVGVFGFFAFSLLLIMGPIAGG